MTAQLTMYTTTWCPYCVRLKAGLKANGITWEEINVEEDEAAAEFVMNANGGNRTVPTILYPDGTTATNPSIIEVKRKLGV